MDDFTGHTVSLKGQKTFYWEGGSPDGELIIFIHGWPDLGATWHHQLKHFAAAGYRVVAPDMRGYGQSSAPTDKRAYSLEVMSAELVELLHHLGAKQAIWVAHDWGSGLLNGFTAHYPELCKGYATLAVPYRTVELGLDYELSTINREIYPESEYPYGQFEYQKSYELEEDNAVKSLETHAEKITKLMYVRGDPKSWGKPSMTASTIRTGGMFPNPDALPDIPLEYTTLEPWLYELLVKSHKTHGSFPCSAWYLNHEVNTKWSKEEKNGGVLEFPVLFIDAKYDGVCSITTTPKFAEGQRKHTKDLTEVLLESAHWVQLEKPKEVNEALEKWLKSKF
ncbi:hypothetical protein KVT40_003353 [Elsinoe batatas]|uniref:AB hydrolase-1 domain-containing protein n=1 Tax=Elsinoe batatas TaxID=2601811 RepID=A0A8K0PJG0_9PEZI|nr:hypothetical protein KVT40_003353 [Elsinoe batatas]